LSFVRPWKVAVRVVEDRGPVGSAGRRLVRVRYANEELAGDPASTFDVRANELQLTR
jgi:hypothetical protein